MSISDFFKKDVVALPSGQESVFTEFKESKYQSQFATLGKAFAGIAVASTFVACVPSTAQIEEMKAGVPLKDKNEICATIDSTLLAKIDSLHFQAGETMQSAVQNGFWYTQNQARESMPETRPEWSAKDYFTYGHIQARRDEARDAYVEMVWTPMLLGKVMVPLQMPVTKYTYRPEFREELSKKVEANKAQKTLQTAQVVKSIQAVR